MAVSARTLSAALAVWNLAALGTWLVLWPRSAAAPAWTVWHGTVLLWLWAETRGAVPGGAQGARLLPWTAVALPWLCWTLGWCELGEIHSLAAPRGHDAGVARLDLALCGVHWHRIWAAALPAAWVRELMHLAYLSYFPFVLVPPLALALQGRRRDLGVLTAVVVTAYLGCFLTSLLLPVYGPRLTDPLAPSGVGVFAAAGAALRQAGDSPGTAFPSSHCAGALAIASAAWSCFRRRTAALLTMWATLIVLSTIYTGNHYTVDALVGSAWALLVGRLMRREATSCP